MDSNTVDLPHTHRFTVGDEFRTVSAGSFSAVLQKARVSDLIRRRMTGQLYAKFILRAVTGAKLFRSE